MGASDHDEQIHQSIAAEMLKAVHAAAEAASRVGDVFGRPMTPEERAELQEAKARADALAAERGPDHHGFGNPPNPADDP